MSKTQIVLTSIALVFFVLFMLGSEGKERSTLIAILVVCYFTIMFMVASRQNK